MVRFPIDGPNEIPPTPTEQLCEFVVNRANRGDDVATILHAALWAFSEDLPYAPAAPESGLRERLKALMSDPWIARNHGELARYQEGVTRRGAVAHGEFVKVADLRALVDETGVALGLV